VSAYPCGCARAAAFEDKSAITRRSDDIAIRGETVEDVLKAAQEY